METIKEFIVEAIKLPEVWIYMITLAIVGWNLPAIRKGLNKDNIPQISRKRRGNISFFSFCKSL